MRFLPIALALVLLMPVSLAQGEGTRAHLEIGVQPDHSELHKLTFSGLKRLTQYQGICLPDRATESRVYDDLGNIPYTTKAEGTRRVISFSARTETVHVDMSRAAASASDHPLYAADVNFCVPHDSSVTVTVEVPDDHTLFFLSDQGHIEQGKKGTTTSDGPTHIFYSYEAPLAGQRPLEIFDEGDFRIFVTPTLAEAAREIASSSRVPYAAALEEAGLAVPFDRIRVLFMRETPNAWESGHYNGHGFVVVKESALDGDRTTGYPYTAVKVLVHESFHAATFPYGQGEVSDKVSWFLEGTARHSERHVDRAMPNASIHCEKTAAQAHCWSFDDRLSRAELDAAYASNFTFDTKWEPSLPQDDDTRRFYYGLSEFIVASWIKENGAESYQNLWRKILDAFNDGKGCPCGDGWLLALLDEPDLFRPWEDEWSRDPAAFSTRTAALVKDEGRLQAALAEHTGLSGLPVPGLAWGALVAGLGASALLARPRARR